MLIGLNVHGHALGAPLPTETRNHSETKSHIPGPSYKAFRNVQNNKTETCGHMREARGGRMMT